MGAKSARRYLVRGRVQGVGYRYYVQKQASAMGLDGFVRNLEDGRVEVYAIATTEQHGELSGLLWKGPHWSGVRGVDECEEPVQHHRGFHILH